MWRLSVRLRENLTTMGERRGKSHYFRLEVGGLAFLLLGLAGVLDFLAEEDPRLCLSFEDAAADTLALVSAGKYI
jgi:hypothetical protein